MTASFQPLIGGCLCGQVRYAITAPLRKARSCHCSRCRKAFSGAGSAYAEVDSDAFSWTSGASDVRTYPATDDAALGFCSRCGTTLCGFVAGRLHGVTLGSVDGDPGIAIEMHIFVDSKAPWDHIGGDAPRHAGAPPAARGS